MRKIVLSTLAIALSFFHAAAQNILPTPMSMEKSEGHFVLRNDYRVSCPQDWDKQVEFLIRTIDQYTQLTGKTQLENTQAGIRIIRSQNPQLGSEGYQLNITPQYIEIKASQKAGALNGITTLLQLIYQYKSYGQATIPCLEIKDKPKYSWRGFMLDSGRQYQSTEFIKKYLRHMAMLKMNVFHWHLTEFDGWRVEIKRYPKLTSIGSKVAPLAEQQGYYTQKEIKDIVAYARELNITVVPEIDMPGHANAALYAYPEMTCFGGIPKQDYQGHSPYLFCAGRESTYRFLENILDEVCSIFKAQYIHLGGDEAPKTHWDKCADCQAMIQKQGLKNSHDLQIYFSKRLAEHLNKKGVKAILWDDVLDQDGIELPDNVVIHWWNYQKNGDANLKKALERNIPVIGSPNYFMYLNYPLSPWSRYKENRTSDMEITYSNNPLDSLDTPLILGLEGCMWTDWNVQQYMIDQRVFPRIYALSEKMWSLAPRLPFEQFYPKVKAQYPYLKQIDVNYGPALKQEVPEGYRWQ